MKFSIVIPAHNSAEYIGKALRSVACQTYRDYEVIVVCDACTDDTENVAYAALSAIESAVIIDQVEYHCDGPTRSRGLDIATGEWVLFMDDDDWWVRPDVLEILANVIDAGTVDFDILAFAFEWPKYQIAPPRGNNGSYWPAVWTKCWNREFIGDTRFPNIPMESDFEFWKAMAAKKPRIADMDVVLYHYNYMRKGSQTERNMRR